MRAAAAHRGGAERAGDARVRGGHVRRRRRGGGAAGGVWAQGGVRAGVWADDGGVCGGVAGGAVRGRVDGGAGGVGGGDACERGALRVVRVAVSVCYWGEAAGGIVGGRAGFGVWNEWMIRKTA